MGSRVEQKGQNGYGWAAGEERKTTAVERAAATALGGAGSAAATGQSARTLTHRGREFQKGAVGQAEVVSSSPASAGSASGAALQTAQEKPDGQQGQQKAGAATKMGAGAESSAMVSTKNMGLIHRAVRSGNVEQLQHLMTGDFDLNELRQRVPGEIAQSPLAIALDQPPQLAETLVGILLQYVADPNGTTSRLQFDGTVTQDPILMVALWRNLPAARMLLEAGAQVNARNALGQTPLIHVCSIVADESNTSFLQQAATLLIEYGADVKARDSMGLEAHDYAAWNSVAICYLLRAAGSGSYVIRRHLGGMDRADLEWQASYGRHWQDAGGAGQQVRAQRPFTARSRQGQATYTRYLYAPIATGGSASQQAFKQESVADAAPLGAGAGSYSQMSSRVGAGEQSAGPASASARIGGKHGWTS
jgi:hypothetical protein